jgi:hypothetical protein
VKRLVVPFAHDGLAMAIDTVFGEIWRPRSLIDALKDHPDRIQRNVLAVSHYQQVFLHGSEEGRAAY